MSDIWAQIISDIEPELNKLTEALKQGPTYPISIRSIKYGWVVTIDEEWHQYAHRVLRSPTTGLSERRSWADRELSKWENTGGGYLGWIFKNKHDAEKFITLYRLVWGK